MTDETRSESTPEHPADAPETPTNDDATPEPEVLDTADDQPAEAEAPAPETETEPETAPEAETVPEAAAEPPEAETVPEAAAEPPEAETVPEAAAEPPEAETVPEAAAEPPAPAAEDADEDDAAGAAEFAAMLAADTAARETQAPDPKPGAKITGKIVQIGDDECFVDYGGRSELPISTAELRNAEGELTVKEGDEITAFVMGKGSDMKLGFKRKVTGRDPKPIQDALSSGVPLEGTVKETNKGGFVVDLGGWRAFCPISQIDNRYVEDPSMWVGRKLEFRVIEFAEKGRRLVVSRRSILEEERQRLAAETRRTLAVGDVYEGRVVRILNFGAFVDIGGVEGLVHISELSHVRIDHPGDVVAEGDEVKVQVMDIQGLGQGKSERISLSMKSLADDPWSGIENKLVLGEWVEGVVVGTTNFGAFVEVLPGVNGLVHVSALSSEPVNHPDDVVAVGQQISVRVLEVDPLRRRISLSLTR